MAANLLKIKLVLRTRLQHILRISILVTATLFAESHSMSEIANVLVGYFTVRPS